MSGTIWPGRSWPSSFTRPRRALAPVRLHQHAAQVVVERDRRVAGRVDAAGDARRRSARARSCARPRSAACRPVSHACWTSCAGVAWSSVEPSTHSRVRLKSRLCLSTAPATTSPSRSPCSPKRATSPSSAAVSMSWLDASAYGPPERANGMRLPPRMAARRGGVGLGHVSHSPDVSVHLCRYPGTVRRMSDRYQQFADSRPGRLVVRRLGLPEPGRAAPPRARRARAATRPRCSARRPAGGSPSRPRACWRRSAPRRGSTTSTRARAAKDAGLRARDRADEDDPLGALLFDASGDRAQRGPARAPTTSSTPTSASSRRAAA